MSRTRRQAAKPRNTIKERIMQIRFFFCLVYLIYIMSDIISARDDTRSV